jgi:hypothetical protein
MKFVLQKIGTFMIDFLAKSINYGRTCRWGRVLPTLGTAWHCGSFWGGHNIIEVVVLWAQEFGRLVFGRAILHYHLEPPPKD